MDDRSRRVVASRTGNGATLAHWLLEKRGRHYGRTLASGAFFGAGPHVRVKEAVRSHRAGGRRQVVARQVSGCRHVLFEAQPAAQSVARGAFIVDKLDGFIIISDVRVTLVPSTWDCRGVADEATFYHRHCFAQFGARLPRHPL